MKIAGGIAERRGADSRSYGIDRLIRLIGLHKQSLRRYYRRCSRIESLTERYVHSDIGKLSGKLRFATEAMHYPWSMRIHVAPRVQKIIPCADAMYYQRLPKIIGKSGMQIEKLSLQSHVAATQMVEA